MQDNRSLNFWAQRAPGYNSLEWANNLGLIEAVIRAGNFKPTDTVLDVGTGTGIVAKAIAPKVGKVIGIDSSLDMLKRFDGNMPENCTMMMIDVRDTKFDDDAYDVVTARYAFHHFVGFAEQAARECYRVLKPNGRLIICEGTPPSERLRQAYTNIFALKEERLTLMEDDIINLLEMAGFKDIINQTMWLRNMSVRNWLNSSGLPEDTKDKIFAMHIHGDWAFQQDYNLKLVGDDCLIDMRQTIVWGVK